MQPPPQSVQIVANCIYSLSSKDVVYQHVFHIMYAWPRAPEQQHRTRGQVEVGYKPPFHFLYPLPGRNKTNPWCSAQKAQGQFLDLPFKWLLHKLRTARTAWQHKGFFQRRFISYKITVHQHNSSPLHSLT